jgi:hypothetical protein
MLFIFCQDIINDENIKLKSTAACLLNRIEEKKERKRNSIGYCIRQTDFTMESYINGRVFSKSSYSIQIIYWTAKKKVD